MACDATELDALVLLCAHAADMEAQRPQVLATLQDVAARLGYPSLPAYLSYHMVKFVFAWCARLALVAAAQREQAKPTCCMGLVCCTQLTWCKYAAFLWCSLH